MSRNVCSVEGCGERKHPLHTFPLKDKSRLKIWLEATGNASLLSLPESKLACRTICHKHFEQRYSVSGNRKLAKTAVPTLYLPGNFNTEYYIKTNKFFNCLFVYLINKNILPTISNVWK